jgi:predicted metal-dependent phosphoesterase TrpH
MKISIHIHSEYSSDSKQPVASIIEESRRLGYDAIAITDHNTVSGSLAALKMKPVDLSVIAGAEFSTEKGHILALFIDETIEKSCGMIDVGHGRVFDFDELAEKVRAQNGLLFLAHPLESSAVHDHSFIARLDGYEQINARINSSHKDRKAKQLSDILKAAYPDKKRIGGSDAHTLSELKSAYMTSESNNPREALKNANAIHFKKSSMAKIRWHTMLSHKNRPVKYYIKQAAAMAYGLLYDVSNKIRGDSYEIIRVRAEDK